MKKDKLDELIKNGATRKCSKCNLLLPVVNYHIVRYDNNEKYKFNSPCKSCANKNRNINYQKEYQRKSKYNLSQDEYLLKLKNQNYSCLICNTHQDNLKKILSIDHCHNTGKIRGLLCNNCNAGIGFFKDNVQIMKSAIKYINKNK